MPHLIPSQNQKLTRYSCDDAVVAIVLGETLGNQETNKAGRVVTGFA